MKPATVSIFLKFTLLTETTRKRDYVYNGKEGGEELGTHHKTLCEMLHTDQL